MTYSNGNTYTNDDITSDAQWAANLDSLGASDEDFATFVAHAYYMWKTGNKDVVLTKQMMRELDTVDLTTNLRQILDEIVFSDEIDPSAWWKQPD